MDHGAIAGVDHGAIVDSGGSLWTFGRGNDGQLGYQALAVTLIITLALTRTLSCSTLTAALVSIRTGLNPVVIILLKAHIQL